MNADVKTKVNVGGKVGFFGYLQLIFITGKLFAIAPVASWTWWTVLLPTLIPLVIVLILAVIAGLLAVFKS